MTNLCVSHSVVSNSATPQGVAQQAPQSMGFSSQEYWSGLPFLSPEDLFDPGIEPWSPALQTSSLPFELQGSPYDKPRQHIKKQRHFFAYEGLYNQSYGFSSSHVWIWELDHKEGWASKNWCFWTVVLKTLESPLECMESQPVNPKGNQSWMLTGRTDAEAEAPILWPPDGKNWLIGKDPDAGKDWRQEEMGMAEDVMVGWHHHLDGHEFEQAPGVGDGQGRLECCSPWVAKNQTQLSLSDWTELKWTTPLPHFACKMLCWKPSEISGFFFLGMSHASS